MKNKKIFIMLLIGILGFICGAIINDNIKVKPIKKVTNINNYYCAKYIGGGARAPINLDYLKDYSKNTVSKGDLRGKEEKFIKELYGEPTYEITHVIEGGEQLTVTFIYGFISTNTDTQDLSAIYIILKDNKVVNYYIDEFNGVMYSEISKSTIEKLLNMEIN